MATFHSNAARICELSARIRHAWSENPHGSEHHAACEEFHRNYDSLAFPGGLRVGLERLAERDPQIVELVIQFLEFDPRFFRSGYIKEKFLRRLKRCDLTDAQRRRLANMILRSVDSGGRREFKGFSRLAVAAQSPMLVDAVTLRQLSSDPEVVRRANAVMHVWESNHLIAPVVGESNGRIGMSEAT